MDSSDKIKFLSDKIVESLFKGEKLEDLEKDNTLTDDDKEDILFSITNKNKRRERLELKSKLNKRQAWENFIESTKQKIETKPKPKVKQMYWYYAAAASIVILLGTTIFLNINRGLPTGEQQIIVDNNIETGTDKATLTLEDGTKVALEKGTSFQTQNASSNGEQITYDNSTSRELVYNYLTIPRGGQFQLTLSDGTQVWLNSETQLKYPVSFTGGESRQVELLYGEAYFDVSPSTDHNGAKFRVFHRSQDIEVLGTEFNVKAYKGETNIYTTLVEGKVALNTSANNQILAPNQQANFNITANTIEIAQVDVYNETSWRQGIFSFKNRPLIEIMQVLSRWYDVDAVHFENKALETVNFDGVLNKNQNISDILNIIKDTGFITNYTITDKKITIQ